MRLSFILLCTLLLHYLGKFLWTKFLLLSTPIFVQPHFPNFMVVQTPVYGHVPERKSCLYFKKQV